jgi:hypothetical protein
MTKITIYRLLFFLTIICMLSPSCKKQRIIRDVIEQHALAGDYQLIFFEGGLPEYNQDSFMLASEGMMCNLNIESEGNIICYTGDSHETKAAEWEITETETNVNYPEVCHIYVRMHWPVKMHENFEYFISPNSKSVHTTHVFDAVNFDESSIFFNNKITPYGWHGVFHFRKTSN